MDRPDTVDLVIPARLEYVRLTRLVVSGIATQAEFSVDEIEDMRIAVDELCATLIDQGEPGGDLRLRFTLDDATLRCEVTAQVAGDVELDELSAHILLATVDAHHLERAGDRAVARLEKTRSTRMS